MIKNTRNGVRRGMIVAAAIATAVGLRQPGAAVAAYSTWNTASGNWTSSGNWTPSQAGNPPVPGNGFDALIFDNDSTNRVITYDYSGSAITLNSLQIYNQGAGSDTLSQSANTLSTGIEDLSSGSTYTLSGGVNQVTNYIAVGDDYYSAAPAVYNLEGTGLLSVNAASAPVYEMIGTGMPSIFNQSGSSTNNAGNSTSNNGVFEISTAAGYTGTYNLNSSNATLNVKGTAWVGGSSTATGGTGALNISAGTMNVTGALTVYNTVNTAVNLSGTGTLSVGSLNTSGNPARFLGNGTTTGWTGGTLNITGSAGFTIDGSATAPLGSTLNLANGQSLEINSSSVVVGNSGSGSLTLSNAASQINVQNVYLGGNATAASGTGVMNISAGTASVAGTLKVWNTTGTAVNLSGGTLSVGSLDTSGNPARFLGNGTTTGWTGGTLNITGSADFTIDGSGTAPLGSTLNLANGQSLGISSSSLVVGNSGSGSLTLSNAASQINVQNVYLGGNATAASGTGVMNISAGTASVAGTLKVWNTTGTAVNLSGGTLSVGSLDTSGNPARFLGNGTTTGWTGGTLNITGPAGLTIDSANQQPLGSLLTLSGGQSLNVSGSSLVVGDAGMGTISQTAGTVTAGVNSDFPGLMLGKGSGSGGYYNLGGTGSLNIYGPAYIGVDSNGTFTQNGGNCLIGAGFANTLYVGLGNYGTYALSGGSLTDNGDEIVGYNLSTGVFNQSGGVNTVGSTASPWHLYLGFSDGASGTYNLDGTGSLTVNGSAYIGGGDTDAGPGGVGVMNISAGAATVTGTLKVWNTTGSRINLSGGTLNVGTLDTSGNPALFNWTGGTLDTTNLSVDSSPGSPLGALPTISTGKVLNVSNTITVDSDGVLNLNGGTISCDTLDVQYPSAASGFNWTSGTLIITNPVGIYIQPTNVDAPLGSGFTLTAGQVLDVLSLNLGGEDSGGFFLSGGTLNCSSLFTYDDPSSFTWTSGTLNLQDIFVVDPEQDAGQFGGTVTIGSGMVLSDAFSIDVHSGGSLTVTGSGSFSTPASNVSGGTLAISGGTATVTGLMKISSDLANSGLLNLSGGTLSVGSLDTGGNSALFKWTGGTLNLTGGSITAGAIAVPHGGTLTGTGTIIGSVTNHGTVSPMASSSSTLNISSGNFIQNSDGTLSLRLGGATQGTQYDFLQGTGTAALGGALTFSLVNSFIPTAGESFQILSFPANSISGSFSSIQQLSGFTWDTSQLDATGTITLDASATGPITSTYNTTASGNWNVSSSWTNSDASSAFPNNNGATVYNAVINGSGVSATQVSLPVAAAVNNLNVSSATLNVTNAGALTVNGTATIASSGALTNSGSVTLAGGTLANSGSFTSTGSVLASGTISGAGSYLIQGSFTQTGNLVLNNTSTFNFASTATTSLAGYQMQLNGSGYLVNNGTFNLSGGAITAGANGAQFYNSGGTLSGPGSIAVPLINYATVNSGAGLSLGYSENHAGGSMTLGGVYSMSGPFYNVGGAVTFGGTPSWTAGALFNNQLGTATFNSDAGSATASPLNVNVTGGSVLFTSTQHLASLSVSTGAAAQLTGGGAGNRSIIITPSLSVAGTLDLTSNDLVIQGGVSTLPTIVNELKSGFNAQGGYWNGTTGIVSTTAAADTRHLTTLGYRTGGSPLDGVNTTANDVLVKYTYYGDANLDGSVNGADYQQIDSGFGSHLTGWQNGDFNYDGAVDGSDYSLIDNTFNQLTSTGASPLALVANPAMTAVPEPSFIALLFAAPALLSRRNRRQRNTTTND